MQRPSQLPESQVDWAPSWLLTSPKLEHPHATTSFKNETAEQAHESRAHYGVEQWQMDAWVSTCTAIADGSLAGISTDVEKVLGRPAQSFLQTLRKSL